MGFVSACQPAFTNRLYSCLMAGASYVSLGAETPIEIPGRSGRAVAGRCSVGEVCGAMREVFGEYQPES